MTVPVGKALYSSIQRTCDTSTSPPEDAFDRVKWRNVCKQPNHAVMQEISRIKKKELGKKSILITQYFVSSNVEKISYKSSFTVKISSLENCKSKKGKLIKFILYQYKIKLDNIQHIPIYTFL